MASDLPIAETPRRAAEMRLAERRASRPRPSDAPLVWAALAAAIGLVAAPLLEPLGLRPEYSVLPSMLTLGIWWHFANRVSERTTVFVLLAAIAILAAAWSSANQQLYRVDDIGRFAASEATPVCFHGTVTSVPRIYPAEEAVSFRTIPSSERTVFEVRVERLRDKTTWLPASGLCQVTVAGAASEIRSGDRLKVFGRLRRPQPALNPGQRDLAEKDRAARRLAIVWCEAKECVTRQGSESTSSGNLSWLDRSRAAASASIERWTSPTAAPLVKAMLLGDASQLNRATYQVFRYTGTVHLLVVSGLHVGLLATLFPAIAAVGVMPKRLAWILALVMVVGYVLVVGARPPAVRAGIVVGAASLAALLGRHPLSVNSLAGAGLAVFAFSPGAFASVGTQLSFTAAATLIGVSSFAAKRSVRYKPPLQRLILSAQSPLERTWRSILRWACWCLAASIAVQIVAGPLVASEFHLVSPLAAPLSLVLGPLLWVILMAGFALTFCAALLPDFFSAGVGAIASAATDSLLAIIHVASKSAAAGIWTAGPAPWWVASWSFWCVCATGPFVYWPRLQRVAILSFGALVASAFAPAIYSQMVDRNELQCTFIAVGHGSSTLVETPEGGNLLVDAGALGDPNRVSEIIANTLWSHGVHRIDALVLTHPDADHYNAVPGLLERMPIDVVLTTTLMFPTWDDPEDRSGPAELKRLLDKKSVPIRTVGLGDHWRVGETEFTVLHPDDIGVVGSDNANSLVLGIEHQARRVLLPGDLEEEGLEALLRQEPYDCDLLLAPHHGSQRSDPAGFAQWCHPEVVVLSSGARQAKTGATYAEQGAEVRNTQLSGAVTVRVGAAGVAIQTYRKDK